MNFNYALDQIQIKANWFAVSENNKFRVIGEKGLNLYFNLFKFRLYKQEQEYLFTTSIEQLRKETGYTSNEIATLFKVMVKIKILCFNNVSRWDRVKDKDLLICYATDLPEFEIHIDENGKETKKPKTDDDQYTYVEFRMLEHYKELGLNEKYFPLYCHLRYLCSINNENKAYAPVEDLATMTGYHKDVITKMIHKMNRLYLLYSHMRENKSLSYSYYYYEHYICMKFDYLQRFSEIEHVKKGIASNIRKWDKKKSVKSKGKTANSKVKVSKEEDNVSELLYPAEWDTKDNDNNLDEFFN